MYDTDEEIRLKRRKLIMIIGIIIFVIFLLLLLIFIVKFGKKKTANTKAGELSCELEVMDGVKPDNKGIYHQGLTIGFK